MVQEKLITSQGDDQRLPSGEKVDFGNNRSVKVKKFPERDKDKKKSSNPTLPNGDKPLFGINKDKERNIKDKHHQRSKSGGHLSNGIEGNSNSGKPKSSGKDKKEVYAGSSFHSSPEALKLPKPSFSNSPKLKSDTRLEQHRLLMQLNQVPIQPVTAYPSPFYPLPQMIPEHRSPLPTTQMPTTSVPLHTNVGLPMRFPGYYYPYFYGNAAPSAHSHQHPPIVDLLSESQLPQSQNQGQKISFDDLLSSSK